GQYYTPTRSVAYAGLESKRTLSPAARRKVVSPLERPPGREWGTCLPLRNSREQVRIAISAHSGDGARPPPLAVWVLRRSNGTKVTSDLLKFLLTDGILKSLAANVKRGRLA